MVVTGSGSLPIGIFALVSEGSGDGSGDEVVRGEEREGWRKGC